MDAKDSTDYSWTPDLFGPVFNGSNANLRQAMHKHLRDKRTRILATLVPDELIYTIDLTKKDLRRFLGVLLLIEDIGFSALSERYNNMGQGGTYGLTTILNSYISIVVENIYSCEGDILKFSADGLLAMWKVRKYEFVFNTIHLAISCALHIQETLQSSKSHVKLLSRGKMSISAGNITFSVIGNEKARHFVVAGTPLIDARKAKKHCIPGDLVLASSAWDHCTPCNYEYIIKDASNVKIARVIEHPIRHRERIRDPYAKTPFMDDSELSLENRRQIDSPGVCLTSNESVKFLEKFGSKRKFSSVEERDVGYEIFTGRISVAEATRRKLGIHLRTFMLKPVLHQIGKDEPLENLSELRRVTVVSINMIPEKCSVFQLVSLLDECFLILTKLIPDDMGCRVTLLDRDVLFLIVFGLRGYEKGHHCKNGITSAMNMFKALKVIPGVKTVSIGVTTGMVYCGVIGHAVRKQYAIIGPAVEKASKIIFGCHDKVICEFDTILHSELPKSKFISQGIKELKGYGSCHIYEFIDEPKSELMEYSGNLQYDYPILGRFQELELFLDVVDDIGTTNRSYCGILIRGKRRTGKSRILDAFVAIIRSRRVMSINLLLEPIHEKKPLSSIYHILINILGATDCDTIQERERVLIRKLAPIISENSLCYLNTLLRVNFHLSNEYCADDDWSRHVKTMKIFDRILQTFNMRKCILLDNVQFLDRMSWQYICRALKNNNIILAMTISESDSGKLSQISSDIIGNSKLFKCSLDEWDSGQTVAFACQLLNVMAIPKELETHLKNHNDQTPGWCEAYITMVLQNRALSFIHLSSKEAKQESLIFPPVNLIAKIPKDCLSEEVIPSSSWQNRGRVFVCLLNERYEDVPRNLSTADDVMVQVYSSLNSYEQELLKCAAVLGYVFTRNMLQAVMSNFTQHHTNKAITELMRIQILECGSVQRPNTTGGDPFCYFEHRQTFSDCHHLLHCACHLPSSVPLRNLPNYAYCMLLEFKVHGFREILLEQILPNQSLEFHTKAVKFYEKYAMRCTGCGGGTFFKIPGKQHKSKVTMEKMPSKLSLARLQSASTHSHVQRRRYRKRSFLSVGGTEFLDVEHDSRQISILPTVLDQEPDDISIASTEQSVATFQNELECCNIWKTCCFARNKRLVHPRATGMDPSLGSQLKIFGSVDFRNCQCNYVVNCMFWKILQHVQHLDDPNKYIGLMIDYEAGLILTGQSAYALKLLRESDEKIELVPMDDEFKSLNIKDRIRNKEFILSLIGDANVLLGKFSDAKKSYLQALSLCNTKFHMEQPSLCCHILYESGKFLIQQECYDYSNSRILNSDKTTLRYQTCSLLRSLSDLFRKEANWKLANLAALKSLNKSFKYSTNFIDMCESYLTAVTTYRELGYLRISKKLESIILRTIKSKGWWTYVEEIVKTAEVYMSIFYNRILRGELTLALVVGFKVLRISAALHLSRMKLSVIPLLVQIMIKTKRIHEAVDLMQLLSFLAEEDIDKSAFTWYYALCLDFILDVGIIVETYEDCLSFAQNLLKESNSGCYITRDPDSLKRLLTGLWSWQLRMGKLVVENIVYCPESYLKDMKHHSFSQILTVCKVLECYLIVVTRCINMKKAAILMELRTGINLLIRQLNGISKVSSFVKPRLYLLKSYRAVIYGRNSLVKTNLSKAKKCAVLQENQMMTAWIKQNTLTWQNIRDYLSQVWIEHVGYGKTFDSQQIHNFNIGDWSAILYQLPIPERHL